MGTKTIMCEGCSRYTTAAGECIECSRLDRRDNFKSEVKCQCDNGFRYEIEASGYDPEFINKVCLVCGIEVSYIEFADLTRYSRKQLDGPMHHCMETLYNLLIKYEVRID